MCSFIKCPPHAVCDSYLKVSSKKYEDGNKDNKVNITGTPMIDPETNKYTMIKLTEEIPVCSDCGIFYSDIENTHQNKYLSFTDSIECCVCFKTECRGVSYPNCLHYTCIPCHKRLWFGPIPKRVEFPYCDDIKRLYCSDAGASVWKNDPKIKKYIEECNLSMIERDRQWEKEENLRNCSICRR